VSVKETFIDTGYRPRKFQDQLHQSLTRFNVIVAHRRFGKTVFALNDLIHQAINCPLQDPRYYYIAPIASQAKRNAWDYLKRYTQSIPNTKSNETSTFVEIPLLWRIQIIGAKDIDSLRGFYMDGVVIDEYAQLNPRAWPEIFRPALTDRKGTAIIIGTPMGRNAFWDIYNSSINGFLQKDGNRIKNKSWKGFIFKASDTGIIDPEEMRDIENETPPEIFDQEYECSFTAAILGAYYGKHIAELERKKRIVDKRIFDPLLPVNTHWDLGIGDSTAIWFWQILGKELRIIDYYEANGVGLDHYADVLRKKNFELRYNYLNHYLPHDAMVRELGTGRTRVETLTSLGINVKLIPMMKVEDGINAVRVTLADCWFDAERCALGLEALRQYRSNYDDTKKVYSSAPIHDWTSHAADAFRYLSYTWREQTKPKPPVEQKALTYADIMRDHEMKRKQYRDF
jgi:phage terminase large subunit